MADLLTVLICAVDLMSVIDPPMFSGTAFQ